MFSVDLFNGYSSSVQITRDFILLLLLLALLHLIIISAALVKKHGQGECVPSVYLSEGPTT